MCLAGQVHSVAGRDGDQSFFKSSSSWMHSFGKALVFLCHDTWMNCRVSWFPVLPPVTGFHGPVLPESLLLGPVDLFLDTPQAEGAQRGLDDVVERRPRVHVDA